MGGSLYFYTMTTYMQKFLVNSVKMDPKAVSTIMSAVLVVFMLLQPVFGALSDKIGRKNNMICFSGLAALSAVPLLSMLSSVGNAYAAFALIMAGLIIASFYTSISGVVKADLFPAEVRALGVGLPYAIANALFGGTAEYVALSLKSFGYESLFFYYVAVMAGGRSPPPFGCLTRGPTGTSTVQGKSSVKQARDGFKSSCFPRESGSSTLKPDWWSSHIQVILERVQGQGHPEELRLPFRSEPLRIGLGRHCESEEEPEVVLSGRELKHDFGVALMSVDEEMRHYNEGRVRLWVAVAHLPARASARLLAGPNLPSSR